MARPRTPAAVADAKGAAIKNPKRYRGRAKPKVAVLGAPPSWMTVEQRAAWRSLSAELPWLAKSDRAIVEVAAVLRARLKEKPEEMGVNALAQLRMCLSQMGATPADRTKVSVPDDEEANDPAAEFMH